jgi:hypothetical protein
LEHYADSVCDLYCTIMADESRQPSGQPRTVWIAASRRVAPRNDDDVSRLFLAVFAVLRALRVKPTTLEALDRRSFHAKNHEIRDLC